MYDRTLLEDIRSAKRGIDNMYAREYVRQDLQKIVKNRTKEKIWFLDFLLSEDKITKDEYELYLSRVERDCKEAWFIMMTI